MMPEMLFEGGFNWVALTAFLIGAIILFGVMSLLIVLAKQRL